MPRCAGCTQRAIQKRQAKAHRRMAHAADAVTAAAAALRSRYQVALCALAYEPEQPLPPQERAAESMATLADRIDSALGEEPELEVRHQ